MRQDDGCLTRSPLKNSSRFSANAVGSPSPEFLTKVLMKKKGEEFLPGDLVFAEFPGYSWPALVTQVGAKTLEVVTLILEQDELIDKNSAVIFQGVEQLKQIMSVLTPGEQQDFSEASNSLLELSLKSRQERLDIIKTGRISSDEGESSKENEVIIADKEASVTESPPMESPKKDSNGVKEVKKLSCDIDDITLPLVGSRLDKIIDHPRPKLTLEVGIPNFGTLDPPARVIVCDAPPSSEGESEIEVKLPVSPENVTPTENGTSPSKRKKLQVKQQRDEDYITNAVKLTNKLFESGGQSVELTPGHHLSYDSLKIARERAMMIAGCASPTNARTRRKSSSKSNEAVVTSPEDSAAKAHAEHLKATRAAQKKALKSIGKPLEIVQTTAKNPSRRPGRKSSNNANGTDGISNVLTKIAAEIAFQEAAEKLVVSSEKIANNVIDSERALQAAATEAAQELVSHQPENHSPIKSPVRKRRHSKRKSCEHNISLGEIIVNSDSLIEIQKALSPQKVVTPSTLTEAEKERMKKINDERRENLKKAREVKQKKIKEAKLNSERTPVKSLARSSARTSSKSPSNNSPKDSTPISANLNNEPVKSKEQVRPSRNPNRRRTKQIIEHEEIDRMPQLPGTAQETEATKSTGTIRPKSATETPSNSSAKLTDEGCLLADVIPEQETSTKMTTNSRRKSKRVVNPKQAYLDQEVILSKEIRSSRRNKETTIPNNCVVQNEQDLELVSSEEGSRSDSLEKENQSLSAIKPTHVEESNSSDVDVIRFLCPYYLNLFTNVIKHKIENQIKLDLEKLPQEEQQLILKLVKGTNSATKKQAYDIISKLVKTSPCQNLLTSNLPEVGPGTPPASPKTDPQRVSNKVIPQTRKRNANSNSQDILHNPFPVETNELTDKARKKYMEPGGISKKTIPRTWSQYVKNNGRFTTEQSKLNSFADESKSVSTSNMKVSNKRKKTDPPQSTKKENNVDIPCDHKMMALLLYVKDIQITLPEPLKLKYSEVKWTDLNPESQSKYIELCEKLNGLSAEDRTLECTALDLFVKSSSNVSRLNWLSLNPTKHKKFLKDAKNVTKKMAVSLAETQEFSEKLVTKLMSTESRKRKRESQPLDTDSEPSSKKEKADDTLLDFFCLDCFTIDYNPKLYTTCHGCHGSFHRTCLQSQSDPSNQKQDQKQRYYCKECQEGPVCLLCRKGSNLKSCSQCPYKYHESCVRPHMSTQIVSSTSFICPFHVCGSCEARPELNIKNFVRCVRCPQSFHHNHIPAGCMRISKSHILCFRHCQGFGNKSDANAAQKKRKRKSGSAPSVTMKKRQPKPLVHLNVPFCFQCTFGGDLICCEGCPASFHNECVPEENQIKEGEVSWLCPDCIVGKKPFIGDIVWVKFGAYRWWPCQILDELDLPDNIFSKPHKPCQFPAICLGTKEFAWLDMSRVYSYEDGDKGSASSAGVSSSFRLAIIEAKDLHSKVKPMKEALLQVTSSIDKPSTKKPAPFKFIKINAPYNAGMKNYEKQLQLERMPFPCDCTLNDKCSADSSCINRVLLTECPAGCKWGEQCENQRFQRRQYPATKLVKAGGRGWGLVVEEDVTPGTLVHEYVGEIIDEQEVVNRLQNYQASGITDYYMLTVENSRIIDAKPKANNARFMNHSCDPNCETQKWNVLGLTCIGLFAKRDIKSGEELTFDYQFDTRGQEKKACLCGSSNCSGFLGVPAKKMIEISTKEPKKKTKKRRRKKVIKEVKPDSPSTSTSQELPSEEKLSSEAAAAITALNTSKQPKKGAPRTKKAVSLPVKPTGKPAHKGVKATTKSVLKNTILSKRKSKAEENDIEDDLQKIQAIVSSVEGGEAGSSQQGTSEK